LGELFVKIAKLLLISAIVCFVLYDIITTVIAFDYLGSFQYETSFLLKNSFGIAGVPGFILAKAAISIIALLLVYLYIEYFPTLCHDNDGLTRLATTCVNGAGLGILAGATMAGLFVGTSNLNIPLNGSSIWLLGLDSGTVAIAIIIAGVAIGSVAAPLNRPFKSVISRTVHKKPNFAHHIVPILMASDQGRRRAE
jgi:hypothetical protein